MSLQAIRSAAAELADEIRGCLAGLRDVLAASSPDDAVYGFALVIADDFDGLQAYANTASHFAESDGGMLDKWYFGQWWSEGMEIEADALVTHLGGVEEFDESPETGNAPHWLAAMTEAMRIAGGNDGFVWEGKPATVFCSMLDSLNAVWLEDLSARYLNDATSYEAVAPKLRAAAEEWYGENPDGSPAFRAAYEGLLSELAGMR